MTCHRALLALQSASSLYMIDRLPGAAPVLDKCLTRTFMQRAASGAGGAGRVGPPACCSPESAVDPGVLSDKKSAQCRQLSPRHTGTSKRLREVIKSGLSAPSGYRVAIIASLSVQQPLEGKNIIEQSKKNLQDKRHTTDRLPASLVKAELLHN